MTDADLDQELHDLGSAWREEHTHAATVDPGSIVVRRRLRDWSRPVGAAAAVAAVVGAGLVINAERSGRGHGTSQHPRRTQWVVRSTVVPLGPGRVESVGVGATDVVVSYGSVGRSGPGRLEVRPRSDLSRVVFTATSSYHRYGGFFTCVSVEAGWVVWTDLANAPPNSPSPGPPTAWRLVAHNLETGAQHVLDSGLADTSHPYACPARSGTSLAWRGGSETHATAFDLATAVRHSLPFADPPAAILPSGYLVPHYPGGGKADIVLLDRRTGAETVIRTVHHTSEVQASGSHVVWWQNDPASEFADPVFVRSCTLPVCGDVTTLWRQPNNGNGHVGDDFVAFSMDDSVVAMTFDGTRLDVGGQTNSPFKCIDVSGDALAFCSTHAAGTPLEHDDLHLVTVRRR